ncbi:MFS transporter [Nitratireductor mangrovi]|uniref:MFS transporter n=1 Tax=Nitratireductor mangrovi TaxID=2599600 RepID=A0A5B8L0N9_9HYPH|nr:MFS transporter [Nitratireductor mangrovi]QDZ01461.1 MFS transporter [Nitratireductor mangrovi]
MAGAQNFAQLALARLGVGIGEADADSPAHSMI